MFCSSEPPLQESLRAPLWLACFAALHAALVLLRCTWSLQLANAGMKRPSKREVAVFETIERRLGPAKYWPNYMRRQMFKDNLTYKERFKLYVFLFLNGADGDGAIGDRISSWFEVRPNALRDRAARNHVTALLKAMHRGLPRSLAFPAFSRHKATKSWPSRRCRLQPG